MGLSVLCPVSKFERVAFMQVEALLKVADYLKANGTEVEFVIGEPNGYGSVTLPRLFRVKRQGTDKGTFAEGMNKMARRATQDWMVILMPSMVMMVDAWQSFRLVGEEPSKPGGRMTLRWMKVGVETGRRAVWCQDYGSFVKMLGSMPLLKWECCWCGENRRLLKDVKGLLLEEDSSEAVMVVDRLSWLDFGGFWEEMQTQEIAVMEAAVRWYKVYGYGKVVQGPIPSVVSLDGGHWWKDDGPNAKGADWEALSSTAVADDWHRPAVLGLKK